MITSEHFFAALHVLSEVLPFSKQLSPETRGALWELFPAEAKRDLTAADLQWAIKQRLMDPEPPRDSAISYVFLHYLYPKRDGWPALDVAPRRMDPQVSARDERKVFRAGEHEARPVLSESRQINHGSPSLSLSDEPLVRHPMYPEFGLKRASFWREFRDRKRPDVRISPADTDTFTDPNWLGDSTGGQHG